VLGAAAQTCANALRPPLGAARAAGAIGLLLVLVVVAQWGRLSPYFHQYREWGRATYITNRYLEDLRTAIERTPDGSTLDTKEPPHWIHLRGPGPRLLGAAVLVRYSVSAWCDLVFPDRRIRVEEAASGKIQEARSDELLVLLHREVPPSRAAGSD
jgi:hypothetical protein